MTGEEIKEAVQFLTDGGLDDVMRHIEHVGLDGDPNVELDTPTAMALCFLANEGLAALSQRPN